MSTSALRWSTTNGARAPTGADASCGSSDATRSVTPPTDRYVSNGAEVTGNSCPLRRRGAAVRRHRAAELRGPGAARRLAAAENRFVGAERHFLNLQLC